MRNRREFLKQTGVGVAGMAALNWGALATHGEESNGKRRTTTAAGNAARGIPPHRPLNVPGVHAYSDQQSIAAGQTVSFLVSSTVPYRFTVCRLGLKVDDPAGDEVLNEFPLTQPKAQSIHPGSYIQVKKNLA